MKNLLRRTAQAIDRSQQRRRWLAFPFAVGKKFGEDQAGNLAGLVAYYGFFSLFPLLLVLVSVLGILLRGHPGLQQRIVNSALANFPIVGPDLRHNVHALSSQTTVPLVVGLVVAVWAGIQVVKAMEHALDTVWNIPRKDRPGFVASNARALVMLAVFGAITLVSAAVAGLGAGSGAWGWAVVGVLSSLGLNIALFLLMFRILTVAEVAWRDVLPGALFAGASWTVLLALGGYIVGHQVRSAVGTYGSFATVIGLLAWIYLGAQVTLLAAELNVVRANGLWPRSIMRQPPTSADQIELKLLAKVEEREEGQEVLTTLPDQEPAAAPPPPETRKSA